MPSRVANIARVLRHMGPAGLFFAVYGGVEIEMAKRVLGKKYLTRRINGQRMYLDVGDPGISRTLLLFGRREEDHRRILRRVLTKGMRVFDIGANIGYYALLERSLVGDEGSIVAIEPSPSNAALLSKNIDANGYKNITVKQAAVSDRAGMRDLHLSRMSNLNTFHDQGSAARFFSGEVVSVETTTVPLLADAVGPPDFIRMDVEGHEVEIIRGLVPAVEAGSMAPMILFETHRSTYTDDHDIRAPLQRLFDAGYSVPFVASSTEAAAGAIERMGYRTDGLFSTDFQRRAIFQDLQPKHLLDMLCGEGGVRTVLLAKNSG